MTGKAFPALATPRLRLRQFEARDLRGLHACFGDADTMRFWNRPASSAMAETERTLKYLAKTTSPYDHLAWAVTERAKDQCIGMVCYNQREARDKRLDLGYILAPQHQGKGYGTEAVRAVLDYCVGRLGAHRVQALVHPDNTASIRLVERLGFRCEGGPLKDYWCVGGCHRSAMIYALIATTGGAPIGDAKTTQAVRPRKTARRGQ
jgi:[ribosomal protein S5]-alanine N-acetyltransferase